jgi:hypothetical protein
MSYGSSVGQMILEVRRNCTLLGMEARTRLLISRTRSDRSTGENIRCVSLEERSGPHRNFMSPPCQDYFRFMPTICSERKFR